MSELIEAIKDEDGTVLFHQVWECIVPPKGVRYIVAEDEWRDGPSVPLRIVKSIKTRTTPM